MNKKPFPTDPKEYVLKTIEHISNNLEISLDFKKLKSDIAKHNTSFYSHKFKWKKQGIPFEHGVFLFIIGPALGLSDDRPKHITLDKWVIDFYEANPQLTDAFKKAEEELFLPKG